ncbi:uncharacterized protein LOC125869618 [Solanum stenotomum]|uniref:uncharacterized protein LOC125869618 n=1 Tax=Solanum stenotomum TaxID=172797 RepID=UPI0020D15301|nr:uncharacterized protein LOC125869618 [Solanum stenotomum]
MGNLACLGVSRQPLAREIKTLETGFMQLGISEKGGVLASIKVRPIFIEDINAKQFKDESLNELRNKTEAENVALDAGGVLSFRGRICIPRVDDLIQKALIGPHSLRNFIHPGVTKMYRDFIGGLVKYEPQRPAGLLQKMPIPEWKWEMIDMDFVVGLSKTMGKFDFIWVVVDRLTKSSHFILVRVDYNVQQLARIYVKEIVRLHGVPLFII